LQIKAVMRGPSIGHRDDEHERRRIPQAAENPLDTLPHKRLRQLLAD
jgi:hypothetical protein